MDLRKICFIINTADDTVFNEMLLYIKHLLLPDGFQVEYKRVCGKNIAKSYNEAMRNNNAKYKIYVKAGVYLLDIHFIFEFLEIFEDKTIGLIAANGFDLLPLRDDLWCTQKEYGMNLKELDGQMVLSNECEGNEKSLHDIQRAEGSFIITQYDILWREDIFTDDLYYAGAQSLEFIKKNYRSVILEKGSPICLLDGCTTADENLETAARKNFLREYEDQRIENSIQRNYLYLQELKKILQRENNIQEKVNILNYIAHFAAGNFSGVYCDPELEWEIYSLSNHFHFNPQGGLSQKNAVLHVMTEAYEAGGHTRVVESWIRTDTKHRHFLILTGAQREVPVWLQDAVECSGGKVLFVQGDDFFSKAENLFQQSLAFDILILSIHNFDLVPLLAYANNAWNKPVRFINHSDHLFWLGVGVIDQNLNITEFAQKRSIERRQIANNILLYGPPQHNMITTQDEIIKNDVRRQLQIQPDEKVITSMAPDWRYTNSKEYDFPQFVLDVLAEYAGAVYIIIGASPDLEKWSVLKGHPNVIFPGTLQKSKVNEIFSITDLYVDSFANSSGGCLADAVAYGLPVLSLTCDRVDALIPFNRKNVSALKAAVVDFLQTGQMQDLYEKQRQFNKYYSMDAWVRKMEAVYGEKLKHKFHPVSLVEFKIEKTDMETARQFNPRQCYLFPAGYLKMGRHYLEIKQKIEEIYRIRYEEDIDRI